MIAPDKIIGEETDQLHKLYLHNTPKNNFVCNTILIKDFDFFAIGRHVYLAVKLLAGSRDACEARAERKK